MWTASPICLSVVLFSPFLCFMLLNNGVKTTLANEAYTCNSTGTREDESESSKYKDCGENHSNVQSTMTNGYSNHTGSNSNTREDEESQGEDSSRTSPSGSEVSPNMVNDVNGHFWNKTYVRPIDFQQSYCLYRCFRGRKMAYFQYDDNNSNVPKRHECYPCDCNKAQCIKYGTCCPDVSEPIWKLRYISTIRAGPNRASNSPLPKSNLRSKRSANQERDNNNANITPSSVVDAPGEMFRVSCLYGGNSQILIIASCPVNYNDSTTIRLCQDKIPPNEVTLDTFVHMTDTATYVTYLNVHCAKCHGIDQLVPWNVEITCQSFQDVYPADDRDEFLRLSMNVGSTCNKVQSPPSEVAPYLKTCSTNTWYRSRRRIFESCNKTGKWESYDPEVEKACHSLDRPIFRLRASSNLFFKNIFCLMCNGLDTVMSTISPSPFDFRISPSIVGRISPFTLLLGFGQRPRDQPLSEVIACSDDEWSGPDNTCKPLLCSQGRRLKLGECASNFDQFRGLPYSLNLWFVFSDNDTDLHFQEDSRTLQKIMLKTIHYYIVQMLEPLISVSIMDLTVAHNQSVFGNTNHTGDETNGLWPYFLVYLSAFVEARPEIDRDVFEKKLLDLLFQNTVSIEMYPMTSRKYQVYASKKQTKYDCKFLKQSDAGDEILCATDRFSTNTDSKRNSERKKDKMISVDYQMSCPFIHINESAIEHDETFQVFPWQQRIFINFTKSIRLEISGASEFNHVSINENGSIYICRQLLDSKLATHRLKSTYDLLDIIAYIQSHVCFGLSIICLILTLITYVLFPSLRCEAGIHNMFLSGSLAFAQTMLLVVSHMSTSDALCAAMGMITHFSWLFMFSWSFLCCLHMLKVFTAPTRSQKTSTCYKMFIMKRLCFSVILSVIVMACTSVPSLAKSNWDQYGYGHTACYLDTSNIPATVVPLGVMIVCNLTFYIIVVVKIHGIKNLQPVSITQGKRRSDMLVYVKLSTLTGMFWLIAILSEAFDNKPLRFIAILLNGSQGIFIFFSYTCNQRVWKLYRQMLGLSLKGKFSQRSKTSSSQLPSGYSSRKRASI